MADLNRLQQALANRGFSVSRFASAAQAADYLDKEIDGVSVGIGGSLTVKELGLADRLAAHNTVYWHWNGDSRESAVRAQVYLCSVNGAAETGELVNIDGTGNRLSATLFGPQVLYLVIGANKVAPDFEKALWRARNIAAPQNAQRLGVKTPCAAKGDRCYDCSSPERICQALTVLWGKPSGIPRVEVVLVDQPLGL